MVFVCVVYIVWFMAANVCGFVGKKILRKYEIFLIQLWYENRAKFPKKMRYSIEIQNVYFYSNSFFCYQTLHPTSILGTIDCFHCVCLFVKVAKIAKWLVLLESLEISFSKQIKMFYIYVRNQRCSSLTFTRYIYWLAQYPGVNVAAGVGTCDPTDINCDSMYQLGMI